jgi:hypothetical protein
MKSIAMQNGLKEGVEIDVHERAILKNLTYATREIRCGRVLKLYDHYFYCQMSDGSKESFRYNEFLGNESVKVVFKGQRVEKCNVYEEVY